MKLRHEIKLFFLLTPLIFAGHPLNTEDAFNVGKNNFEMEIVSEYINNRTDYEFALPLTFSYGLTQRTDIMLGISFHKNWNDEFSNHSFNDIRLEVKHILIDDLFKIGIKPFVNIPTGDEDKGFGKGKLGYGLIFMITKEWEKIHIHTQFGYTRNNNVVREKEDLWEYSIALEKFLYKDFSAVVEFGISRNCCRDSNDHPRFILGGIIFQTDKSITLDLGLIKGLTKNHPDFGITGGITLAF